MSASTATEPPLGPRALRGGAMWNRQLDAYPAQRARLGYLAVTVLCTVTLYYELYVQGSVSTPILEHLHMSFGFLVYTTAIGNLLGAFGALFGGIADRVGRTRLVVGGLLITGIFTAVVIPTATNQWTFTIYGFVVSIVEGMCLVATPALVRDFSPQTGRATAMGFWTTGPVLGSLVVSAVGSLTIASHADPATWTHQYRIAGVVGLVVTVVAALWLKELSPGLRDQLMVSASERKLVEARAKGVDVEAALREPWHQVLKPSIVVAAVGSALFLLFYYTSIVLGQVYYSSVFGFSVKDANSIGNWQWGLNVIGLLLFGWISDKLRVRKPIMVVGAIATAVLTVVFLQLAGSDAHNQSIGYQHVALTVGILSFASGIAYVPWLAGFTETIEHYNPALTATGLAVWAWITRIAVCVSFVILPVVINTMTPLVKSGGTVADYAAGSPRYHVAPQYPALAWAAEHPKIVATAQSIPSSVIADAQAIPPSVQKIAATHATQLADAERYAAELKVVAAHPALFEQLARYPSFAQAPRALQGRLLQAAGGGAAGAAMLRSIAQHGAAIEAVLAARGSLEKVEPYAAKLQAVAPYAAKLSAIAPYGQELAALQRVPAHVTAYVSAHGDEVARASEETVGQWKTWYWVCFGGVIVFLFSVPFLKGHWSPRAAKADAMAHEALVARQLAELRVDAATSKNDQ